jgi:protein-tyrosine phosphatase
MYVTQMQIPNLAASSAGTRAMISHPIHDEAARVLKRLGGEASDFAARQLTPRIAADADLVLTMTRAHRDAVLEVAPNRLRRTFTLSEGARLVSECNAQSIAELSAFRSHLHADETFDIDDPIGQGAEYFLMIGSRIATLLPPLLELFREH